METGNFTAGFISTLVSDPRIGTAHMGLYAVLLVFSLSGEGEGPVVVPKETLMRAAKIGSPNTWFKMLNDLDGAGCLEYRPSFSPKGGSRIRLSIPGNPKDLLINVKTKKNEGKMYRTCGEL